MARPSKLTPEVVEAIVEAVASGLSRRFAALSAGVSTRTLFAWQQAGRQKKGEEFVQFLHRIKKAEGEAVAVRMRQIDRAARNGKWQAAAWWLERMHPDVYGNDRRRVRELAKRVQALSRQLDSMASKRKQPVDVE